ncbi:hypothetical protein VTH06DRAFT_5046 [Thermothelomyces fergusii]
MHCQLYSHYSSQFHSCLLSPERRKADEKIAGQGKKEDRSIPPVFFLSHVTWTNPIGRQKLVGCIGLPL